MFHHEGKMVIIDQFSFTLKSHADASESNIPMINQNRPTNESLRVGMYTSLMGTFDLHAIVNYIGSTSVGKIAFTSCNFSSISNKTDSWILPT